MERLLSPQEVADALGVPVKTLYRWRQNGYGPTASRIGKHLRYRADDVAAFIDRSFETVAADTWVDAQRRPARPAPAGR